MPDLLCPVTEDGRHNRRPWAGETRCGLACVACHKTWVWVGKDLVETYELLNVVRRETA